MSQDIKGGVYWMDDLVDLVEHRHNKGLEGELCEFELEGQTFHLCRTKRNVHFLGYFISCVSTLGGISLVTFNPKGWDFKKMSSLCGLEGGNSKVVEWRECGEYKIMN